MGCCEQQAEDGLLCAGCGWCTAAYPNWAVRCDKFNVDCISAVCWWFYFFFWVRSKCAV